MCRGDFIFGLFSFGGRAQWLELTANGAELVFSILSNYTIFSIIIMRNIDKVATESMRFTDYYAEASCTVGRANFHRQAAYPHRARHRRPGRLGAWYAQPGTDHRHRSQGHGLRHWAVWQKSPGATAMSFCRRSTASTEGSFRVPAIIRWPRNAGPFADFAGLLSIAFNRKNCGPNDGLLVSQADLWARRVRLRSGNSVPRSAPNAFPE
jgi:hypothetical protein